jgi:hypothetical protein
MSLIKISGAVILAGSIAFLVAAFLPISRVYALSNAMDKLAMIQNATQAWGISQLIFSLSSMGTSLGVALAAYSLRDRQQAPLFIAAAALLVVGAAIWTWHVYLRAIDPTSFVNGSLPGWHFALYTHLTLAAFLLTGIALLQLGFPKWSGWFMVGSALLVLILYLIFNDIPPFVHYLMGLALGFVLFRGS